MKSSIRLILLMFLFSACGPTRVEVPSPAIALTATPTPKIVIPHFVTGDDIKAALLTLDDLPDGWEVKQANAQVNDIEGDGISSVSCFGSNVHSFTSTSANFQKGKLGPFLVHTVALYPPGGAYRIFEELEMRMENCDGWKDKNKEGKYMEYEIQTVGLPLYGTQSLGLHGILQIPDVGTANIDIDFVRTDDVISSIWYIQIGTNDTQQDDDMVNLAQEKLEEIIH